MQDVLLAGVLGAAVLAIVLLHRAQQKHAALITELRAEVTAQKIAALTQQPMATVPEEDEALEPVRRKRHLALYIGSGVAAVLSSLGERLRSLWQRHRAATATGTAVVVATAGTAAALYLTSTESAPPAPGPATPPAAAPEAASTENNGEDNAAAPDDADYLTTDESRDPKAAGSDRAEPKEQPSGGVSPTDTEQPGSTPTPGQSPSTPSTTRPADPAPPTQNPPSSTNTPGKDKTPPAHGRHNGKNDDCRGVGIGVRPVLELCAELTTHHGH
ncbi:hypothetical protein ABTY98_04985 [Streptomyces sp. NPDC096040]|uniref:hypothetical protein n=1 Tax=Streptomyces sp. NPDC096040 TaxID=3155541 RepID=UPI00332026C0